MKKIYLVFAMAIAFATTAAAQTYTVVFAVDATQMASVSPNGIHIAGNFQAAAGLGGDWSPAQGILEDADGNGVWQVTVQLPAGTYQYKYINGDAWGDNEGQGSTALDATCSTDDGQGNINRNLVVSADMVAGPFIYDACTASQLALNATNLTTAATITVAPNPMRERSTIFLSNPNAEIFNMTVTNMVGQVVRTQQNINTDVINIEREDLAAGVYFVTLQNEAGAKITEKLIIQ